uniref:Uncharacterized protein n=1 Tax=viral metagenome TaxID=1070528 RepID=A0A2V0RBS4_9ZZZZ
METYKAKNQKQRIIGAYVFKVGSNGKMELVEEKRGEGFGPIGGRASYMDERDGVGIRGVLAREYVAETGSLLPRDINLTYLGVFYDETERYRYENNIYILMSDVPLSKHRIRQFEIKDLLSPRDDGVKLRHWFVKLLKNDIVRDELMGVVIRNGINLLGTKLITSVWYVYVFPEHNPGINNIYRISVDVEDTDDGMKINYRPKRVTWKVVNSDVNKSGNALRSACLVPRAIDELRNRNLNTNIVDLVNTLPKKEGESSDDWLMFPLHEYFVADA